MKFYPHHIGDFIKDTARLNDSQSMAYLRLIWEYYATEQPLDNDCNAIAFKIGSSASDVEQILRHFFFLYDGKWHQSRCDTVIAEFYAKSEKARTSANIRWEEKKKNANELRTHSDRNANEPKNDATHNPIPISKPKVKSIGATASRLPADWYPSDDDFSFCRNERPDLTPSEVANRFRDYWIAMPGAKGRKLDWRATWRNWVRNEKKINGKSQYQINQDATARALFGNYGQAEPLLIQGEVVQ
jgi:uncharacterized protein YdaU (DUF1376 family)